MSTNNRSRELLQQAKRAAKELSLWQAEEAAKLARSLCPVGEEHGQTHLYQTIVVVEDERTGGALLVAGDPDRGVHHALAIEYGTHRQAAQPYYTPAVEMVKRQTKRRASSMKIYK